MANYYPNDTETYRFIDHFIMQTTEANTNTTVSVSIDGGPPIPMTYQGIINETIPGDTENRNWYTWQVAIPDLTTPGRHTFQFYYHYYVWQDKNQYWADFNAYSTIKSFTINPAPLTPPQTSSNTANPPRPSFQASPSELQSSLLPPIGAPATTATMAAMIGIVAVAFILRKHAAGRKPDE